MKKPLREGLTSVQIRPQIIKMMQPFLKRGLSKTQIINEALHQYLLDGEFRQIRERWIPLAKSKGIYTDEDIERLLQ